MVYAFYHILRLCCVWVRILFSLEEQTHNMTEAKLMFSCKHSQSRAGIVALQFFQAQASAVLSHLQHMGVIPLLHLNLWGWDPSIVFYFNVFPKMWCPGLDLIPFPGRWAPWGQSAHCLLSPQCLGGACSASSHPVCVSLVERMVREKRMSLPLRNATLFLLIDQWPELHQNTVPSYWEIVYTWSRHVPS